jgi:hypothetical protein
LFAFLAKYCYSDKITDRPCSTHGEEKKYIQSFVENPEGKRSLGRRSRRWKDNIKAILKKQIQLTQNMAT